MRATEKLWLTADRKRAVPDGHADAAFLLCVPGGHVDDWEADRLGILGAPLRTATKAVPAPEPAFPEPQSLPHTGSGLTIDTQAKRRRGGK